MKVKNGDIFGAAEPLGELMKQKFPVKVAYGIARLASKINVEMKAIEEVRLGLVKKYGKENEKGNVEIKPDSEKWNEFIKEFNELMNQEIEFVFDKVKIPSDIEGIEFEPSFLMALEKFVEVT